MADQQAKPLAEWLQEEEQDGECRPCAIAVILGDYQKVLVAGGHSELSEEIAEAICADEDPILKVAQAMDEAKEKVDDELRGILLELDSLAQEGTTEEGGNTNVNLSEQHPEGQDPDQGAAGSPGDEGPCS